ncbi:MAG: heavy metal translocating P-type ATPase [Actinomycetota bacterium]
MALPVYLIAENATREVIKQVETGLSESNPSPEEPESERLVENQGSILSVTDRQENYRSPSIAEISYSIVHAIPGRIRFRLPRISKDSEYLHQLTELLATDAKIIGVRVNEEAASIAISYETSLMSEIDAKAHLIYLIQQAPNAKISSPQPTAKTEAAEAEQNPWQNVMLPAFTATLALLGGPIGLPIPPVLIGTTIAITALPVAQRAFESLIQEQKLNIDFLDLMAITITTLQGQFISPSIMILLVEVGEAIREMTARSSQRQTLDLLDSLEEFVWVEREGNKQQISIKDVQKGDIAIVYPGDQIPVDGRILRGQALIDEQKLTGESMPVMRSPGQQVYTSTLVRDGQLYILTEGIGSETRAGQIIKVMQDAPVHDTRIENYAANFADQAVVPTILLSGIVFALTRNFSRAASILTLDFATGIRVSVPTTVLAALTYAARRGILIRSGRALEKLAEVNAIVCDKTGTLTQGAAQIVSVETVNDSTSPLRLLELAAAAEKRLTHPVAEAVVRYAEEQGARDLSREDWDYEIGQGVRAKIDGEWVLVGSDYFLRHEGIHLNGFHKKHSQLSWSTIYVASNGEMKGAIAYRDPLRPETRQVIQALQAHEGMEVHILTGDKQRVAEAVAAELGIPEGCIHAEAFPEQKVAVVKELKEQGKIVAFVGDGINDSPALAYADVSVSFASGSDVARETADVVLMENDLRGLPEAIAIARHAMQVIHQNTAIVAAPNLAAMALAVAIGIDPLAATLVNNGSSVIAGLNGLQPLLREDEFQPLDVEVESCNLERSQDSISPDLPEEESTNHHLQHSDTPLHLEPFVLETEAANSQNGHAVNGLKGSHDRNGSRPKPQQLTGKKLAERLQVSVSTLSRHKSQSNFADWSRQKDPDGFSWIYSKQSKLFIVPAEILQPL